MFDEALSDIKLEYVFEELATSDSWRDMSISWLQDKLLEEIGEFLASMKIDDNQVEQEQEMLDILVVGAMLYSKLDYQCREQHKNE